MDPAPPPQKYCFPHLLHCLRNYRGVTRIIIGKVHGLQMQTTNIYPGPPWSHAEFWQPGILWCSRQTKLLPSWSLPSGTFHPGEAGAGEKGIRPGEEQDGTLVPLTSHLDERCKDSASREAAPLLACDLQDAQGPSVSPLLMFQSRRRRQPLVILILQQVTNRAARQRQRVTLGKK